MSASGGRTVVSSAIFKGMPRIRTMIQMGFSCACCTGKFSANPRMGLGRIVSLRFNQPRATKILSRGCRIFVSNSARVISSVIGQSIPRIRSGGMERALA